MNTFYEGFDGRFYDDGIRAFSRTTHETDIAHSIHQKISDCQNAKHFTCQMRFCRHEMHLPLRSSFFFFSRIKMPLVGIDYVTKKSRKLHSGQLKQDAD